MGITVVSSVSSSVAPTAAATGLLAGDALPADFAALLSGQLSEDPTLDAEKLAELAALNPALASQLLQPNTLPAPGNPLATTVDRDSEKLSTIENSLENGAGDAATKALLRDIHAASGHSDTEALPKADASKNFAENLAAMISQSNQNKTPSIPLAASKTDTRELPLPETAKIAAEPTTPSANQSLTAALSASSQAAHSAAPEKTAANSALNTPLHDDRWTQDFGEKIVWLAKNEQQTAQISINPPQLGPMQISINLNGDQATATFASPHAEVRQAIEDALPRLRDMFSAAGISLGEANVGAQLPQQNREAPRQFSNGNPNGTRFEGENAILGGEISASSNSGSLPIQRGRGLVDLFA